MTIMVFDGTCLVADGLSSFTGNEYVKLNNQHDRQKIRVLEKPWPVGEGQGNNIFITALGGSGFCAQIDTVITEAIRASRTGVPMVGFRSSYMELYKDFLSADVIGVGYELRPDGSKVPYYNWVFSSDFKIQHDWGFLSSLHKQIGMTLQTLSVYSPTRAFKNALEFVQFICAINPEACGGRISRFNPVTGKLDFPKPPTKEKLISLANKLAKVESDVITHRTKLSMDAIDKFKEE